jgi:hypothetical protein
MRKKMANAERKSSALADSKSAIPGIGLPMAIRCESLTEMTPVSEPF